MTTRRFFVLVWRANAILLLLTGVVALAVLSYAAFEIYREATRMREATGVVNVANEQVDRSKTELGQFERIEGSEVLRAPLTLQQQYAFSSGSKQASSIQNYLFYNASDGSAKWLVKANKALFLSCHDLPEHDYTARDTTPSPVIGTVYEMVEADTNSDQRLTDADDKTVAVSAPNGDGFARVLTRVREVNAVRLIAGNRILILYSSQTSLKAAEIDVVSHQVLRNADLTPRDK